MARHCGNCRQAGHYAKTCKNPKLATEVATEAVAVEVTEPTTDVATVAAAENPAVEKARRGAWIVNPERKRIAGKVSYVKSSGEVVYENAYGAFVETPPDTIKGAGYVYYADITPKMIAWSLDNMT